MKHVHDILDHIRRYIREKENAADREILYRWYEDLESTTVFSERDVAQIRHRAKKRIMLHLRGATMRSPLVLSMRWVAAAAAVLLIGFIALYFWPASYQEMSAANLAAVKPAREHALITLADGKTLDLDSLASDQQIIIGDLRLVKDRNGKVTYERLSEGDPMRMNSIQIPKASTFSVVLSDGSSVLLNAGSKMTYPEVFGNGPRIVTLEGEGYFQVEKTRHKSKFIVKTAGQTTEVLGTKFSVKAYPEEQTIATTLAEGSVRVKAEGNTNAVLLKPSQQAVLKGSLLHTQTVDLDQELGWTAGFFCFDGSNMDDVLQQIGRWYDVDIVYKAQKKLPAYSGKIRKDLSLDKLLALLAYAEFKVEAKMKENKRVTLFFN